MTKIHKKKCRFCGKEIESLSKSQCEYNYMIHIGACRKKTQLAEKKDDEK